MGFHSTNKVWKKDETAALIALFETERCLYDASDIDFHVLEKKTEAYERICKIMLRIRPDVSVGEIKYKIKVLRKQYEGELIQRNYSIDTGICSKDSYKPGMWCFGLLQFLDEYLDVKCADEIRKTDEESDNEIYHITETDHQKEVEESSDVIDDSDDHEEIEQRRSFKKRKIENSSTSSSEREPLNSSIRKFMGSSSEKKFQNTSFSVRKFQSSSSVEKKHQNFSPSSRKFHSNVSSEKKIHKPSLIKKSQDTPSSTRKFQNTLPTHKKIVNSSSSLKKLHNIPPSARKVSSSSNFEKDRKNSSSAERELKNSSLDRESKNYSPETISKNQSPSERNENIFFSYSQGSQN